MPACMGTVSEKDSFPGKNLQGPLFSKLMSVNAMNAARNKGNSLPSKGQRRTTKEASLYYGLQTATKKQEADPGPLGNNILDREK